ncbi:MAG: DMT family transporter [Lachnospiraceae bacterium]|nr:DMT family transporter [Lachnospiraceae bacterium]
MYNKNMGSLFLLIAAVFWGSTFVAQKVGGSFVGPFTFLALRSVIGFVVLFPLDAALVRKYNNGVIWKDKKAIKAAAIIGVFLFAASYFQQWGIAYTTAGKAGFITAIYIILVPLTEFLLFHKRYSIWGWVSVAVAVYGFYLLCLGGEMDLNIGDLLILVSAFLFDAEILAVDRQARDVSGIRVSCLQFLVVGGLAAVGMFLLEKPSLQVIQSAAPSILYAGVFSSGIAYTCQILGQKSTPPLVATLLMSLESVFSVIFGFLLLHETMTFREMCGCVVVFAGAIMAQVLGSGKEKAAEE